jgi:Rrf2 family protein
MKGTAMQEYGLRCVMQLVACWPAASLTVRQIAERERLTPVYVEKLLVVLRRAGLVKSTRGVKGGYALSRLPSEISAADVLGALGHVDLGAGLCNRFTGTAKSCVHQGGCGIRPVWGLLTQFIYGYLNRLSLEQLSRGEGDVASAVERLCKEKT